MQDKEAKAIKRIVGTGSTDKRLTFSIAEAAAMLGISRNLAYELARHGELPGTIKLGQKRLVVSRVQLERLLQGDGQKEG